jgi:hypothetical protein
MASLEAETNPPLVVDPDAPIASPITPERLQAIRGRKPEVIKPRRRMQLEQAHGCPHPDLNRHPARSARHEEALRFRRGEGANRLPEV